MKNFYIAFVIALFKITPLSVRLRDIWMWPLSTRILGAEFHAPRTLKTGIILNTYLDDQLGRLALFYGSYHRYFWEPSTTQLLEKLVPRTKHCIVAGTHIGLIVLYARKAMGNQGTIHTFEPIEHLHAIATENFALNTSTAPGEIHLNKSALGNKSGTVTITKDRIRSRILLNGENPKNLPTEQVLVTTIDTYAKENNISAFDLVFLDVEGYEYNTLLGMDQMMQLHPPLDIIYEISFPYKDNLEMAKTIEAYLAPYGYHFYIIEDLHDPLDYPQITPPLKITQATGEAYQTHKTDRYFNVYATKRTASEVAKLLAS